jgi:hypothetical protein
MNKQRAAVREAKTVRDVVNQMAELHADKPFLINPDTKHILTFQEFRPRTINISCRLLNLGLAKCNTVTPLLTSKLPACMPPSAFVLLDTLLTRSHAKEGGGEASHG